MSGDRITANLPSRDFAATEAFYAALGFQPAFRDDGWMILTRGPLEVEFFPWPALDPFSSSRLGLCSRRSIWTRCWPNGADSGLSPDPRAIPRLTGVVKQPGVPRMFALVDPDGSLLRVLENGGA